MRFKLHNLGALGLSYDVPDYTLQPEFGSFGQNVRMIDGSVWSVLGQTRVWGAPTVRPLAVFAMQTASETLYAYPGGPAIYATDSLTHANVSRLVGGAYSGTDANKWNGGQLGPILVLNNGVDVPQAWINPSLAQRFIDLANWPAAQRCKVMRPFRQFLVAGDLSVSGTRIPQRVKWSHPAIAGAVPVTWDPALPGFDAGENDLLATSGAVVDFLELGGRNIVYKSDQVHVMDYIGGRLIFRFDVLFREWGLLAQNCAQAWRNQHVCLTTDDLLIHNGVEAQSLLNGKFRRWYRTNVDTLNYENAFVCPSFVDDEVWACFPRTGSQFANVALIVNLRSGAVGIKDLLGASAYMYDRVIIGGTQQSFDSVPGSFDSVLGPFDGTVGSGRKQLVLVSPDAAPGGAFFLQDSGNTNDGASYGRLFQRLGLTLLEQDRSGQPKNNFERRKVVREVWPKVRTSIAGGQVQIQVAVQDTVDAPIQWSPTYLFTPGVDNKIDVTPPLNGRLFGYRVEAVGTTQFRLDEIEFVGTPGGTY